MLGSNPAVPMAFDTNLLAISDDFDYHPLQQQPNDILAILLRRCICLPQRRQIVRQSTDCAEFFWARRCPPFAKDPFVLSFKPSLFSQRLFPLPLERARYQPVLRLTRIVLTPGSFGLIPRALQTLLPMPLHSQTLGLDIGRNCQADLQRRWLQRFQRKPGDQLVERSGR